MKSDHFDKFGPNLTILVKCEVLCLPVSFFCLKKCYGWFCFIRVLFSQPEAGRNFSTPRPTILGPSNPRRGLKSVKNINFFNYRPILTFDSSFFSAHQEKELLVQTFFSKTTIYPSGAGYYPQKWVFARYYSGRFKLVWTKQTLFPPTSIYIH